MLDRVNELRQVLRDQLAGLLRVGAPVALLDYPNHRNIGDAAIWLGERHLLRDLGIPVAYVADQRGYRPDHLRRALPDGPILLHGGGNFGDLYPKHQRLRERVVADFPDRRIVQLPQTLRFDDPSRMAAVGERFRGHGAFTLIVRDRRSVELAAAFADDVLLSTDGAFGLGPLRFAEPRDGIVWLARTDFESTGTETAVPQGVRKLDWPDPPPAWRRRRLACRGLSFALERDPTGRAGPALTQVESLLFDRLAQERVAAGARLVSTAEVVVTDRLHGHIMSLLCGRPSVVTDNRTGKVRAFFEEWTADSPLAHFADGPQQALEHAGALSAAGR